MSIVNHKSTSLGERYPLLVYVEGNIGSGKSTFIQYCKQQPSIEVVCEPLAVWENFGGTNALVSITICHTYANVSIYSISTL